MNTTLPLPPEANRSQAEMIQVYNLLWSKMARMNLKHASVQHIISELAAASAYTFHAGKGLEFEEALDYLSRELDVTSVLLQPENKKIKDDWISLLTRLNLNTQPLEQGLSALDLCRIISANEQRATSLFSLPDWLIESMVSLAVLGAPLLFLDWGDSALVPRLLLHNLARVGNGDIEFTTLDHAWQTAEKLRLMLALVIDNLRQVRESVYFVPNLDDSPAMFWTSLDSLRNNRLGTIFINLLAPAYSDPRHHVEMERQLAYFLAKGLAPEGRAIVLAPASLLSSHNWQNFRTSLQELLHLEAIVDFSFSEQPVFSNFNPASLSLVLLEHGRGLRTTRQAIVCMPDSPQAWALTSDNPLADLVVYLEDTHRSQKDHLFEYPPSQLAERWDPKYYCPARLKLQDRLIHNPQVAWLANITQTITHGSPSALLEPYITTHITVVKNLSAVATHLKAGDQVWLRREMDNPHDPNTICVERRSGAKLGYLPAELAAEIAEAIDQLGGEHQAVVTEVQDKTPDHFDLGFRIRFSPPKYAKAGKSVLVVKPTDIVNNQLVGPGEVAWLLTEHQKDVTYLQAGDILLLLRGFGKACVVTREFEDSLCHQDIALIRPNENIDPLYLLSFVVSADFQEQLQYVARGEIISIVNVNDLSDLLVIIPPLLTQRRIALAFAESQGELGPGLGRVADRWLDLIQDNGTVERQWMFSSLLSNLFSDWDQVYSLDDWLRLKSAYVRDLRNIIAHAASPFGEEAVGASIMSLNALHQAIGNVRRQTRRNAVVTTQPIEQAMAEFREQAGRIADSFLHSRFGALAAMLGEMVQAQSSPLSVRLYLEPAVLPIGVQAVLRLSVTNESDEFLKQFEIVPTLSSGEFVSKPVIWQLASIGPAETQIFEARVRLNTPGSVHLRCAVSYIQNNRELFQQNIRLMFEAIPSDQISFALLRSPYITGSAVDTPEMFFGRQDVLDFLSANLIGMHQSNVIILQGNRRTGKSSILRQIVNRDLFAPHVPVYVDCQGMGALTNQSFFYKLAHDIWKALTRRNNVGQIPLVQRTDFSEDDPFYDFRAVLDQFTAAVPDRRIVLLIDEFEVIDLAIQKGNLDAIVLENLRHLFQHRRDLAVVLTGSYRLAQLRQDYWSILFGLGLKHEIDFLDEESARRLITQPLEGVVTYSDEAINRITQLTACQPYFVQMVCHNLVNVLNKYKLVYVTQSHVEEAAQETLISADGHMRFMFQLAGSKSLQAILVYIASSLSQPGALPGHEIEDFVLHYRLSLSRSELEAGLCELVSRDILHIESAMGQRSYGFKIDLVRQWIRRNYDLQSAIALAQDAAYVHKE